MLRTRSTTIPLLVLASLAALVASGCASDDAGRKPALSAPVGDDELPSRTGRTRTTVVTGTRATAPAAAEKPTIKAEPPMAETGRFGEMVRASMAFPTGERTTSAVLLEKSAPAEVMVGQPYDYEIRVTNITDMVLENVEVTDAMTGAFAIQRSNPPATGGGGDSVTWNVGSLRPGETKVIRVTGNATGVGEVTACASVRYNSTVCVTTAVVQPALELRKAAPAEALACDDVPLTFIVTNNGTGVARNVTITDNLPAGWTTREGQAAITIEVGNLEGGRSREFSTVVRATGAGQFQNQATARAEGGIEAQSNATTTLITQPVLAITKTGPENRFIGRNIDYEITVTNNGNGVARDTVVEDTLPAGATLVNATEGGRQAGEKVVWNLGTLQPGGSRTLNLTIRGGGDGRLTNVAEARAYCADAVTARATTIVEGIPAILLEVVDLEDPIEIGKDVTYVIRVTNQGSSPGTNIRVNCGFEPTMSFVSGGGQTTVASGAPGAPNIAFQPLPSLAPGAEAVWRVVVKAVGEGDVRFSVSMQSDQMGRPAEETEATHFYK